MTSAKRPSFQVASLSLVLGLAGAIGAILFFAWLANEVLEGETHHFDDATRSAVHRFAFPALTTLMRGISFLGSTIFLTSVTVLVILWFVLRHWYRGAVLLGVTMIGATLLDVTLKRTFHRARPVPFFNLVAPASYSFPSGHALASFCFYGALAAILSARIKSTRVRTALWTISALLLLVIGLSRIYLGVHYTTDVLAGYSAAFIWIVVVRLVDQRLLASRNRNKHIRPVS